MQEPARRLHHLDRDGHRLAYREFGDPDGRPVLYCHGWPGSSGQAALADEAARVRGIRVIAPDRPGIGGSSPRPNRTFRDWPEDCVALADHLGLERFDLLAVSGGSPYALACATLRPDRVDRVSILCGACLPRFLRKRETSHFLYRNLHHLEREAPHLVGTGLEWCHQILDFTPPEAVLLWVRPFLGGPDREALRPRAIRAIMGASVRAGFRQPEGLRADALLFVQPWNLPLDRNERPVHFWHGTEDQNIPIAAGRATAAEVRGAEWTEVPDEGHYSLPIRRMDLALARHAS